MILDNRIISKICCRDNPHLRSLRDQAARLMDQADLAGDDLRWCKHFQIWIALTEAINRRAGGEG